MTATTAPTARGDRLLYTEEVATLLRRSPAAVRYMVHANVGPPSAKIAGRRMWRESEVLAWIDKQFADAE